MDKRKRTGRFFSLGKMNYMNSKIKNNPVTVDISLGEDRFGRPTFSACADIWNQFKTDIYCGGQCLDEINKYVDEGRITVNTDIFKVIYDLWKKYHLNDMHAGTPEQEEAIKRWKAEGNTYDYDTACKYLKSINLYSVEYHGLEYDSDRDGLYRYGHSWLYQPIAKKDLKTIRKLLTMPVED